MTAKEYLDRAYMLRQRIMNTSDRIEKMEARAYKSTRPIDAEATGTADPHARERAIAELADLRTELRYDYEDLEQARIEIREAIDAFYPDHMDAHRIFWRRYLCGWTWSRIAAEMGLKVREVTGIHGEALQLIEVPEKYRNM